MRTVCEQLIRSMFSSPDERAPRWSWPPSRQHPSSRGKRRQEDCWDQSPISIQAMNGRPDFLLEKGVQEHLLLRWPKPSYPLNWPPPKFARAPPRGRKKNGGLVPSQRPWNRRWWHRLGELDEAGSIASYWWRLSGRTLVGIARLEPHSASALQPIMSKFEVLHHNELASMCRRSVSLGLAFLVFIERPKVFHII